MNKDEATRTLTDLINISQELNVVTNTAHQTALLTRAIYYVAAKLSKEDSEIITKEYTEESGLYSYSQASVYDDCQKKHTEKLENIRKVSDTNYVFLQTENLLASASDRYHYTVTTAITKSELSYFAIIGENEIKQLKEIFKGDLTGLTKKAAETLGIYDQIQINYTELLKEEPEKFREYFKEISDTKRKEIIEENWQIFENKQVDNYTNTFLTKNYKHLIEEIARDKLTE